MDKKLKNIAGTMIDFFGSKLHSGVQQVEKKVDHYKQLRDLESEFLDFGIKSYDFFTNSSDIPNELVNEFNRLKASITEFEDS